VSLTTVEGLGSVDEQHPLQRAFSHHHGLQCGFCTPGMLMSAYDLLAGGTYSEEALAEDMSGVLCRCTGYRGILAAVADVARTYPDGVPAPRATAPVVLVGRSSGGGGSGAPSPSPDIGDAARSTAAGDQVDPVTVPSGPPTVTVEVASRLASPVEDVWAVLADFERLAACLPGAEMTADLGDRRFRGRARIAMGPVSLTFDGLAHVVEHDPDAHRMRVLARGSDRGGSSTQAVIRLSVEPAGSGAVLTADADVHLTGRIAQFGRALAGDVSRRMFEQFAASVDEVARTGASPVGGVTANPLRMAAHAAVSGVRVRLPGRAEWAALPAAARRGLQAAVRRIRRPRRAGPPAR
jgi:carbon-monoxide dehydrogenase small subunit